MTRSSRVQAYQCVGMHPLCFGAPSRLAIGIETPPYSTGPFRKIGASTSSQGRANHAYNSHEGRRCEASMWAS
jgi:hypothetical protein